MDEAGGLYAKLEERILARDQVGAGLVFYDLVRNGRPRTEILRETVRIHAPYTHVPYHQRIDNGFVRFVNNDHCLLSARTSLRLPGYLPKALEFLPAAQTMWYVPTGLIRGTSSSARRPATTAAEAERDPNAPLAAPERHWPDEPPMTLDGPFEERLNHWLTLVQRGEVVTAYRVFLGLFADRERRRELLAHLAFAGLIDVQDRMLYNRSYTTGHKGYRARATIELGDAIGWDNAHDVLYAGIPDMAVGPRWHSAYEMACQVSWLFLAQDDAKPKSSMEPSPSRLVEERLLRNAAPLTEAESQRLIQAIIGEPEPSYIHEITALLLAGKNPRRILDVIQVASARVILMVQRPADFSMPHHSFEYSNTLGWFYDTFDHPHRLEAPLRGRLLRQPGGALGAAHAGQRVRGRRGRRKGRGSLSQGALLERLDAAQMALRTGESRAWVQAYLDAGHDRGPLVETLALAAVKEGNDPHNQEIGLCLLEDYGHSTASERDTLLVACAHHTAGHQKFGDPLEAYRRFTEALA